jgi:hypothetical protein
MIEIGAAVFPSGRFEPYLFRPWARRDVADRLMLVDPIEDAMVSGTIQLVTVGDEAYLGQADPENLCKKRRQSLQLTRDKRASRFRAEKGLIVR